MSSSQWVEEATHSLSRKQVEEQVDELHVRKGQDTGQTIDIFDQPIVVGSREPAELILSDDAVSRLHCRFERQPNGVNVRDLGSRNGTWLGGHRIVEAILAPGSRVQIGDSVLELVVSQKKVLRSTWEGGDRFGEMWGRSAPMQTMFGQLMKLLGSDRSVLVRGESGTGKELVARALHELRGGSERPLVVVDGACLSQSLADIELFGNARGAFTDAVIARAGAFERAHTGTVFLDEVGDIPRPVQAKLLRVLEDRTVQRVGDGSRREVDVRVIAATHQPLEQMVNTGGFREDLYHRLATFQVFVPPLRERGADVELIAHGMLEQLAPGSAEAEQALGRALERHRGYLWPGNVRELRNLVRRVAALGDAATDIPHVAPSGIGPASVRVDRPFREAKEDWLASFERLYLSRLLDEAGGNVSEAARRAEVSRMHLTRLMSKHDLKRG